MADTIKVNLAILTKTNRMIEELAALTYRGKADVVDLAVAKLYEEETAVVSVDPTPANIPVKR